uniref:F-box associated domain-containing protein n=1 Tax=Arundo donax TaxID=35708 RepID=A0A0A9GWS5_ARUDO
MHYATRAVVLVFNSAFRSWSVGTYISQDALGLSGLKGCLIFWYPCYAYGYFYWKIYSMNCLLKLNLNTMEFFTVDLPPDHNERRIIVVEAGEGRLGMFSHNNHDTFLNYYTSIQNEGQRAIEWQMKNIIPLPELNDPYIVGAPQGYIFVLGDPKVEDAVHTTCFSLDIRTSKIERVSQVSFSYFCGYPYLGFPPSMSPRRI